jgi:hypothetical protein
MMRVFGFILFLSFLSLTAAVPADEPSPQVRALLEKALKAHGGWDAMQKLCTATWHGRGLAYRKNSANASAFYGEWNAELPAKYRYKYDFKGLQGNLSIITTVNGDKAWRSFGDSRGSEDLTDKRLKEEQEELHSLYLSRLVPLLSGEYQISKMPIGKRDGRYILGLKVEKPGFRTNRLYFDRQLGLLTYMERSVLDFEVNKEVIQETRFEAFQPMGGARLPQTITVKRDGKLFLELEMSKVELKSGFDDKLFTKPPEPKMP